MFRKLTCIIMICAMLFVFVCLKYQTPFIVIRALSDKADGNAHESYENFGDIAADNSSRIVMKMLNAMGE